MTGYAKDAQVTKYVARVQGEFFPWDVLLTGASPKTYLFCALDKSGLYQTGLQVPVRSRDLRPEVARCLNNGVNYPPARRAPVRLAHGDRYQDRRHHD